jgi:hypothetical protein
VCKQPAPTGKVCRLRTTQSTHQPTGEQPVGGRASDNKKLPKIRQKTRGFSTKFLIYEIFARDTLFYTSALNLLTMPRIGYN